jgi:hypothetical protein
VFSSQRINLKSVLTMFKLLQLSTMLLLCLFANLTSFAQTQTLRLKPNASSDDAEQNLGTGAVNLVSTDLELGGYDWQSQFRQITGIRFPNVNLPQGAIISKAYIQFSVDEIYANTANTATITIKAQKGNATTYTTATNNISSRTYTSAASTWSSGAWTVLNQRTITQQTPNLTTLVREAIQTNWVSGNALAFSFSTTANGYATAWSFNRASSTPNLPELVIEYSMPQPPPPAGGKLTNVFINEATGSNTLNNKLDFIELYNNNTASVNLDSVFVTDEKNTPYKYRFAGKTLAAKAFTSVNADGDILQSTPTTAAFGIGASGETVYLFQQYQGALYLLDSLNIGATTFNTSWGRSPDASTNVIAFKRATQGASNNSSKQLLPLSFSSERGLYTSPFSLTLTAPAGSTIRYTTNFTTPSVSNGTTYSSPISIAANTVIKAIAYNSTGESQIITHTYVFTGTTAQQLGIAATDVETALKELPIVTLNTPNDLTSTNELTGSFEYINKFGENKSTYAEAGYKVFGFTSTRNAKKSYRVYFRAKYGYNKLKHKVFKKQNYENYDPTDEFDAFDLKASSDPTSYQNMSDYLSHNAVRKMGTKDVHVQYVNVFVNGQYNGVYPMREVFGDNYAASYYGGNDTDYDYMKSDDIWYDWPTVMKPEAGKGSGTDAQWRAVVAASDAKDYQNLKKRLDMVTFVDNLLMFLAGGAEPEYKAVIGKNFTPKMIMYMKDMDAYMTEEPVSGGHIGYKHNLSKNSKGPNGLFSMSGIAGNIPNIEYQTLVKDRFENAYMSPNGAMNANTLRTDLRNAQALITNSEKLEIARWKFFTLTTWNNRVDALYNNLPTRINDVITYFRQYNLVHTLKAVTFSKASGNISAGENIYVSNPNANTTVYYTTDGSDVVLDNVVSPTAKVYNASTGITLPTGRFKIRARAVSGNNFGMFKEAEYTVGRPVIISAIAYQPNPAAPAAEPKGSDIYEFFQLTNTGSASLDISNFMVTEAIDTFRLPQGTSINGGETIMFCNDDAQYPNVPLRKFKWVKGKLANEGEKISFRDNLGNLVHEVTYDTLTPWPYAKGNGNFIRLKALSLDNSKGGNWEAVPLSQVSSVLIVAPNITNLNATPTDNYVTLRWSLPTSAFDEILIVAKENNSIGGKPSSTTNYATDPNFVGGGTSFDGGKTVYKGGATSVVVTNLTKGKTYFFRVFTLKNGVYTEGVEVSATLPTLCDASGQLLVETWNNIGVLNCVSNIPVTTAPSSRQVRALGLFELQSNVADNFGTRVRGYICAPETGNYNFLIASDDGGEFLISTDENPANKRMVAQVPYCSWALPREWAKYPEQKSAAIYLVAGRKYYMEASYKEGIGGDNLAIGWLTPSKPTTIEVVPGTILSPYNIPAGQNLVDVKMVYTAEARNEGQKAVINWVTNANRRADYYIVEKMEADKTQFEQVDIVNAEHTAQDGLQSYSFTDKNPAYTQMIYRVGMVKSDKSNIEYTAPMFLDFSKITDYHVFPNPAHDVVNIDMTQVKAETATIRIVNVFGKTMLQQQVSNLKLGIQLDVEKLEAGQYVIYMEVKGKKAVTRKLTIMK